VEVSCCPCHLPCAYYTARRGSKRTTQSIMYAPLKVNRSQKNILVIVQYKYLKSCSGDFIILSSAQDHAVLVFRPRMEKSHSCSARKVWCVVNMFHKNGMRQLIIANSTKCYSILYYNSPWLYLRLKYTYWVISVKLNSLDCNFKKRDFVVAFCVWLVHSWAVLLNLVDFFISTWPRGQSEMICTTLVPVSKGRLGGASP